jgi:hypothetical protein
VTGSERNSSVAKENSGRIEDGLAWAAARTSISVRASFWADKAMALGPCSGVSTKPCIEPISCLPLSCLLCFRLSVWPRSMWAWHWTSVEADMTTRPLHRLTSLKVARVNRPGMRAYPPEIGGRWQESPKTQKLSIWGLPIPIRCAKRGA